MTATHDGVGGETRRGRLPVDRVPGWPGCIATMIAAGDTTEEIDNPRRGGDGHIVVRGGVGLWRSGMRLDLIDEFRLGLRPTSGIVGLQYRRRHR